mmetsp:Transcript_3613/g.10221  ORF Transcript_3613/g.10221 Transcript_3613/m.10221 type:complete len:205 (-) Transcript_3613:326-940(-)
MKVFPVSPHDTTSFELAEFTKSYVFVKKGGTASEPCPATVVPMVSRPRRYLPLSLSLSLSVSLVLILISISILSIIASWLWFGLTTKAPTTTEALDDQHQRRHRIEFKSVSVSFIQLVFFLDWVGLGRMRLDWVPPLSHPARSITKSWRVGARPDEGGPLPRQAKNRFIRGHLGATHRHSATEVHRVPQGFSVTPPMIISFFVS